ncbi:hypothetical protein LUZ60_011109 [Juncus effusus]|nr:hypothetical protein LUZ60_011109 [Juncus effusus]
MANQGGEQVTGINSNPSEVNYMSQTQQSSNPYLTSSAPPPQAWGPPHNGYPQNYYYDPNQPGSNPPPPPNPQQYQNPSSYYTPYQNSNAVPVQYNYNSSEYSSYYSNNTANSQVQNNTGAPSYQPPFQNSHSQSQTSTTSSTNYGDPQNNTAPAVPSANYYYQNQNQSQSYSYPGYSAPPAVQSGNPNPGSSYQYQYNNNNQWPYPPPGTTTVNYPTNQPPPPGITLPPPGTAPPPGAAPWRADSGPAAYSSVQELGAQYQTQYPGQYQMYPPKPLEPAPNPNPINNNQHNILYSQNPNLNPSTKIPPLNPIPYPVKLPETRPVLEGSKMVLPPPPPLYNTVQVSKMQVPTNPRIPTGTVKGSGTDSNNNINNINNVGGVKKPAYVSVSVPKNDSEARKNTQDADSLCKGAFPVALRGYVERSFARCKTDAQRTANENLMKEVITKASTDGTLYTKNWDLEPLFPLLAGDSTTTKNTQDSTIFSQVPKTRRKSRWDTVEEETPQKKIEPFNISSNTNTTSTPKNYINNNNKNINNYSAKDTSFTRPDTTPKTDAKGWNYVKFISAQKPSTFNKPVPAQQQKSRKRKAGFSQKPGSQIHDSSSDSDEEKELTKYYSTAISLANNPEEKKRRESRSKRFDKRKIENFAQSDNSIIQRKANAMLIAKSYNSDNNNSYYNNGNNYNNNNNLAVEDIDWDSLTVKGTCQEIEKKYLRLTSAPDPATVRPEEVLEKALEMVQKSNRNYLYKCDQLKSIRQDLTVQRIQNELTVKVYETHARLSLLSGDMAEYNQCQSQLKRLYKEGIKGCKNEFSAYHLLHVSLHSHNKRDLLSSMSRLSIESKEDEAVKHALKVRSAVSSGNYVLFFRLYKSAPNLNTSLMDLYVEKMRFEAVKSMAKAYRPNLPVRYVNQVLGFLKDYQKEEKDEKEKEEIKSGLEECEQWLRAHGVVLTQDSNGDLQFDTKASMASLFMPEPENAVAHGDASLAVDDFLTRAP